MNRSGSTQLAGVAGLILVAWMAGCAGDDEEVARLGRASRTPPGSMEDGSPEGDARGAAPETDASGGDARSPDGGEPVDSGPKPDPYAARIGSGLALGWGSTCAITSVGTVMCWGHGSALPASQTNGMPSAEFPPTLIAGLTNVTGIVGDGYGTTYARTRTGALYRVSSAGVVLLPLSEVTDMGIPEAGSNGVYLTQSGLYKLVAGPTKELLPSPVPGPLSFSKAFRSTCVLGSGQLACRAQCLTGPCDEAFSVVSSLPDVIQVSTATPNMGCGVTQTGLVRCWGGLYGGAPGTVIQGLTGIVQVAVKAVEHSDTTNLVCALSSSGAVTCFRPAEGVLTVVSGLPPVAELAVSGNRGDHACARTQAGAVYCWGLNHTRQLGSDGPSSDVAVQVPGL